MIDSSRTSRIAYACFIALAVLIVCGLVWATLISVKLSRAEAVSEARDEYNRNLRTAMWQIDPFVMNVFAKEAARPYWHYKQYFHPFKAFDAEGIELTGSILTPSPLFVGEEIPEWIQLYFQVSEDQGWHSPQLPTSDPKAPMLEKIDIQQLSQTIRLFMILQRSYSPEKFANQVATAVEATHGRWAIGEETASTFRSNRPEVQQQKQIASEFSRRAIQNNLAITMNSRSEICGNSVLASINLNNEATWGSEIDIPEADDISLAISPMAPIWMTIPDEDKPLLAMVRTIDTGNRSVMQGFLVDWSTLAPILLDRVSDLFEEVSLEILPTGSTEQSESTLTALPARLVAGPEPEVTVGFLEAIPSSVRFAWIAAMAALLGVGFGIRTLLKTSERRSQFAYAVTHELRTPMTTLRLYTDMLADGLVPEEKRPEYIETLRHESQRLSELVSGVLEYSRIENQKVRLDLFPREIADIAEEVRERFNSQCEQADAKLSIANDCDGTSLNTDMNLLIQVLGTLIDNSCKYGTNGDDSRIDVTFREEPGQIVIDVQDNGPGIPRNQKRQIFKPFRRGSDDTTGKPGGIGLGLALARSWTALLGGKLELQPGKGACFRISLRQQ